MAGKRAIHSSSKKAKVALAALRGDKTLSQVAGQYGVHPTQVTSWKQRLLDGAASLFEDGRRRKESSTGASEQELYAEIGRLKMELDWLKKKSTELG
jgi:transposase-like protein